MQGYDLLMIIVLIAAVVWGAWKGFAWQIASLGSMIASYIVALTFRQQLAQYINASPPWNMFLSMLILFLGTSLVVWIGFNLVAEMIEKVKLKEFDRQVGAIFGLAKGVLLCVLITLFAVTLLSEPQRQAICNSRSGYYIAVLLDKADGVIPGELHQVLDPYIDRLDQQVSHEHTESGFELPTGILGIGQQDGGTIVTQPASILGSQPAGGPIEAKPATDSNVFNAADRVVRVPDGGTLIIGGQRFREGRTNESSERPAGSSQPTNGSSDLMMMVTPQMIIQEEVEEKLGIEIEP